MGKLQLVQDPEADALLESNPFALLVGMLLDQQIPMETAFAGTKKIADRLGGVDAREIADYNPDEFIAVVSQTPAIHRFPASWSIRRSFRMMISGALSSIRRLRRLLRLMTRR